MPFDIERELKFSVSKLKSPSRLTTNYTNTAFGLLEAVSRVADVPRSFGVMNEQFIVYKHVFNSLAVKMTNLSQEEHG